MKICLWITTGQEGGRDEEYVDIISSFAGVINMKQDEPGKIIHSLAGIAPEPGGGQASSAPE